MHIYMTKIISISDEAYEELSKLKNGYSFTEIILELARKRRMESVMKFAGAWKNVDTESMKKELEKERRIKSWRSK